MFNLCSLINKVLQISGISIRSAIFCKNQMCQMALLSRISNVQLNVPMATVQLNVQQIGCSLKNTKLMWTLSHNILMNLLKIEHSNHNLILSQSHTKTSQFILIIINILCTRIIVKVKLHCLCKITEIQCKNLDMCLYNNCMINVGSQCTS